MDSTSDIKRQVIDSTISPEAPSEDTLKQTGDQVICGKFYFTLKPIGADVDESLRLWRIGYRTNKRFYGREKSALNADREIRDYVLSWEREKLERIASLYQSISGSCDLSSVFAHIIIPIAAGQEIGSLKDALSLYADQDSKSETWELFLFVNQIADKKEKLEVQPTLEVINKFRKENPELNIRVVETTYAGDTPIGTIRAEAWDVVLYGLALQKNKIHDYVFGLSQDADTRSIPENYISTFQSRVMNDPVADIITCRLDWHVEGNPDSDVNKIIRYWQFIRDERQKIIGRFPVPEASSAIRLSSYAAMGGFLPDARIREMINFQQRLVTARREPEENTPYIVFVEGIFLGTDSRRIYRTVNNGISPHHTWDKLPFMTGPDDVRSAPKITDSVHLGAETVSRIVAELNDVYLSRLTPNEANRISTEGMKIFS